MNKAKNSLYFEAIGDRFDSWISQYDVARRIKLITRYMPSSASAMHCLEVGCGTGSISEAIVRRVGRLTVTDISAKLAEGVGKRLGVEWKDGNACCFDFPDGAFDMVISSECIEHTSDPRAALAEMARVVKSGGVVIVTSPNRLWYPVVWLSTAVKARKFAGSETWLFPWEAARVLKKNGVGEIRLTGCHLFPWQIPCAKLLLPVFDSAGNILFPFMINYGIAGRKI